MGLIVYITIECCKICLSAHVRFKLNTVHDIFYLLFCVTIFFRVTPRMTKSKVQRFACRVVLKYVNCDRWTKGTTLVKFILILKLNTNYTILKGLLLSLISAMQMIFLWILNKKRLWYCFLWYYFLKNKLKSSS